MGGGRGGHLAVGSVAWSVNGNSAEQKNETKKCVLGERGMEGGGIGCYSC